MNGQITGHISEKEIEQGVEKDKKNNHKKIINLKWLTIFIIIIVCIGFGGIIGWKLKPTTTKNVTINQLSAKLKEIDELATYSYEYTDEKKESNSREIFGFSIPGTTNKVDIVFSGVIKVGYNVSDINCEVDDKLKKIWVTLPKAKVLDNYIKLDNLQCEENNNIFNPIGTDQIIGYFSEMEEEELKKAEESGIYDGAEEHVQAMIKNCFAEFSDYEVIFN